MKLECFDIQGHIQAGCMLSVTVEYDDSSKFKGILVSWDTHYVPF